MIYSYSPKSVFVSRKATKDSYVLCLNPPAIDFMSMDKVAVFNSLAPWSQLEEDFYHHLEDAALQGQQELALLGPAWLVTVVISHMKAVFPWLRIA